MRRLVLQPCPLAVKLNMNWKKSIFLLLALGSLVNAGAQQTASPNVTGGPLAQPVALASSSAASGSSSSNSLGNSSSTAATPLVAILPGDKGSTTDKHAFGVLPNYRTADGTQPYIALTTKQKYTVATRDTLDGPSYALASAFSGLAQLTDSNPSFGQGVKGYARRYATALADQDLGNFMTEAIIPAALHEDPRYFRKGTGGRWGRVGYALTRVLIAHDDKGHLCFNTSEILGNGIAASIGNLYYPDARGFSDTMQRAGIQVGTDAISGVLKEFWPDVKSWYQHRGERREAASKRAGL